MSGPALGGFPASPVMPPVDEAGRTAVGYPEPDAGMTIRQRFAMAAMQGLASVPAPGGLKPDYIQSDAKHAVLYADALLAELAKEGAA